MAIDKNTKWSDHVSGITPVVDFDAVEGAGPSGLAGGV
jgi:hypothetical protein